MSYQLEAIFDETAFHIMALRDGLHCDAKDFLAKYEQDDLAGYARLWALIEYIAENGPPRNEHKFKKVSDLIYEIKGDGIRLFCFYQKKSRRILILTHGWRKAGEHKTQQNSEIQKAERIAIAYLSSQR